MPAPTARTISDVEEEARDFILSLNGTAQVTPFEQNDTGSAVWKETSIPFTQIEDNSELSHLLFEVFVDDAPNTRLNSDPEIDGEVVLGASLRVAFTYQLRSAQQKADVRLASDAAQTILRKLMGPWDYDVTGCVDVLLLNAYRPSLTRDGHWVLIDMSFLVEFNIDISAIP